MEKKAPSCMDSQLHFRSGTKKLLIGMVGLPARGKTYISRKLCRYLNWIGYNTQTFVVSEYRRKHYGRHGDHQYFNSENQKALKERTHSAELALNDLVKFLEGDGQVAIYDGTNITQAKRDQVNEVATTNCFQLIWIESICRDKAIVSYYIDEIEARSPDFIEHSDAVREMHKVIEHYEKVYEPIPEDSDLSYVKLIDAGKRVVSNNMGGYLEARMVSFLLNLRLYNKDKVLFISRHGESEYNLDGKIGGDSSITKAGQAYSGHLGEWMLAQPEIQKVKGEFPVWCSTLQRTKQTAGVFKDRAIAWQNLREIDVGICDGMTYEEVEKKYPEEFAARKADKLRYRYPRGESYMDVITRLEPVIFELEKADGPILVIAHRAVLRCLFAYFQDEPASRIPYLDVPLHTVIKLVPKTYSYEKFAEPLGEHIEEKEDGRKSSSQPKPKPPTPRLDTRSHHERAHAHGPSATPTATAATADETADGTAETGSKRKFLGVAFDQASKLEVRGRDDEGVSSPDRREVVAPMALRTGGHHLLLGGEELPSPVALSDSPTSSISSLSSISTPSPSSASYSPSGTYSPRSLDHAPGLAITVAKIFV